MPYPKIILRGIISYERLKDILGVVEHARGVLTEENVGWRRGTLISVGPKSGVKRCYYAYLTPSRTMVITDEDELSFTE